jgi:hypothetical protein
MTTPPDPLRDLEERVGHPQKKWDALQQRIQGDAVKRFSDVQADWLDLMWTLDAYRIAGLAPRDMPGPAQEGARLAAIYRGKGNWFAAMLSLLLENQTTQRIAPRIRVPGFSQTHQIDVAWPARNIDPLVCAETKVTGAPAYGSVGARGAMSDWTNRRKELKFAATDLKLFRRQQETKIEHWDIWREQASPRMYFLWAARLRPGDRIEKMVAEAQALVHTYLEGAGLFAWEERNGGYAAVALPADARISTLDDVLYRIASEINLLSPGGEAPPPVQPETRAVAPETLEEDRSDDAD